MTVDAAFIELAQHHVFFFFFSGLDKILLKSFIKRGNLHQINIS